MKKLLVTALIALAPLAAHADGIAQLKRFVGETRSMKASFSQVVTGRQTQTASGSMELSRPGKFRWSYTRPYAQLIVGDGKRLWVYDQDLAQVTTKKLDDALGSSPAALLAGSNEIERDYTLKNLGVENGLDWLSATPKREGTFNAVRMGFRDGNLVRMVLADSFGQTTTLEFSNLQKNPNLDPSHFRFTPPKGVDVVGD